MTIEGETKLATGRRPNPIVYNQKGDCVECFLTHKGEEYVFLIDKDDLEKVQTRNWHLTVGNKYVGASIRINGVVKVLYLHNFIMNKLDFPGRGATQTVDHINRNGLDNRKCNLRMATQSEQLLNQNKKCRRTEKQIDENMTTKELPKHVYYVKVRGNHGDGFCIEFKKDGKKIYNPYIRSKVLTTEQKLEKIMKLLQEGYEKYPEFKTT